MLNGRAITSLANSHPQDTTAIVTLNSLRHVINRHQTENFAVMRHQTIYVFPSLQTRTRSSDLGNSRLRADDVLHLPDHGTTGPFPETPSLYLLYASHAIDKYKHVGWPGQRGNRHSCRNCFRSHRQVPSQIAFIYHKITRPPEFYTLNNHYIFCNKPPVYLLFKPDRPKLISLQSLDSNILPIFPLEAFLSLEDYSIR